MELKIVNPTLADVAQSAGVSMMTASRALNGRSGVAQNTKERVLAKARELGYVANMSARSLVGGRMNVLGLVVPDLVTQFVGEVAAGSSEAAEKLGFDLLIYTTSHKVDLESARIKVLKNGLVDGILAVLPRNPANILGDLTNSGMPVVIIDSRGSSINLPTIVVENYNGARYAVEHLIALGHKRIGFLAGAEDVECSKDRLRGYREGLLNAGLAFDQNLVRPGNFRQPTGFQAALELLRLPNPPTAIFAANDLTAFGAIEAVKEVGLRVPHDVSVVGFDDIQMATQVHPPLTTVKQPLHQMGISAVNLLVSMISGITPVSQRISLPTELIVRSSTAAPPKNSGSKAKKGV